MIAALILLAILKPAEGSSLSSLPDTTESLMIKCINDIWMEYKHTFVLVSKQSNSTIFAQLAQFIAQRNPTYTHSQNIFLLRHSGRMPGNHFKILLLDNLFEDYYSAKHLHLVVYSGVAKYAKLNPEAWSFGRCRVLIVDCASDIYIYDPFESRLQFFDKCENKDMRKIKRYYDECIDDFKGRNVSVAAIINSPYVNNVNDVFNPGWQVLLIKELANVYNFRPHFEQFLSIEEVLWRRPSFILGAGNGMLPYKIEAIPLHFQSEIIVSVPLAQTTIWLGLIKLQLWIIIACTSFLITLITWLTSKYSRRGYICNIFYTIGNALVILIPQGVKPNINLSFQLFMSYILYFFLLLSVCMGIFQSYLFVPLYDKQISTLNDVIEAKLTFRAEKSFRWEYSYPELDRAHLNNYQVCENSTCLENVYQFRNIAYLTTKEFLQSRINRHISNKVHPITISKVYVSVSCAGDEPFLAPFKIVSTKLWESGILMKWFDDTQWKLHDEDFSQLNFYMPWSILLTGWVLAVLAFCLEYLYSSHLMQINVNVE